MPRDDDALFRLTLDVPIAPHHADIGIIRLRPRPGKEHMVQIARSQFRKLRSQGNRGHMAGLEEGVVIGQLIHLRLGDIA
ncbi:MAG: hypothetical protein ACD_54C01280G0001 [uncultured bacterium]|nr:MAG: hypothetical protein ACD_54C01280G0001 [uncultured bacterium]